MRGQKSRSTSRATPSSRSGRHISFEVEENHLQDSLDLCALAPCLQIVLALCKAALEGRGQALGKPGVLEDALQVDALRGLGFQHLNDEVLRVRGSDDTVWEAKLAPTSSTLASEIA